MEFLHALVGNLLEPRCKIAVLAVDDEIDRSLRVFQEKDEAPWVDRIAVEHTPGPGAYRYANCLVSRAVSLQRNCVDQRELVAVAPNAD